MEIEKEKIEKLILLLKEIADQPGKEWVRDSILKTILNSENSISPNQIPREISEIYELCIKSIIKEQAEKFYENFKLNDLKEKLIHDFIRMESFRRNDNFEDFCLAAFQQVEGIINYLSSNDNYEIFIKLYKEKTHKSKNKITEKYEDQMLWQLIFNPELTNEDLYKKINKPINEWEFASKFKLFLFIYYFKKKVYNKHDYDAVFYLGNELYQARNLNHRGGNQTDWQKSTIKKVKNESGKYYFKFLGFLENLTTKINENLNQ
jgi:hypothetical protein